MYKNEVTVSVSSPEALKLLGLQFISGTTPFVATEALYAHNLVDCKDFSQFPLVIEGHICDTPLEIKFANVDFVLAAEILALFGFKTSDLLNEKEEKFFKKFQK